MNTNEPPTYEILRSRHRSFLQREPEEDVLRLYRSFPSRRGFAGETWEEKNEAKFEAGIVLALVQAFENKQVRVPFFVPRPLEKWAYDQTLNAVKQVFNFTKNAAIPKEKILKSVEVFKYCFGQIALDISPAPPEAPLHWVAYGYPEYDPRIPLWLREGILL